MPKSQVKVFNPVGLNKFTSLECARRDVKRHRAHWIEVDMVIKYSEACQVLPPCRRLRRLLTEKPAQSVALPSVVPAVEVSDSHMGQTFLAYPQPSLESCRPKFPTLARPGAGFGASA